MSRHVTRLAPSPTGAMHLGNLRTFLVNHLLARRHGWRVLMRIEDLDSPRVKAGAAEQVIEELRWLGLEWDGPVAWQSQRADVYQAALDGLIRDGVVYPCVCTRQDVEQAGGAPHGDDGAVRYPGTCRGRFASAEQAAGQAGRPVAWRLKVADAAVDFTDAFAGPVSINLHHDGGDFVVFKNIGQAAYQLAVVVDDAQGGVDRIVRGDDLLSSAARQIELRRALGLDCEPTYCHLPLVVGPDGRRLAKRHGDTRLAHYRQAGASPQRVLGLLGYWCGLIETRRDATMEELLERFDLARLPRQPMVLSPADDAFLLGR